MISLPLRTFLAHCALGFVLSAPAVNAQPQTPWPTKEWALSTPHAEGLDAALLADLYDYLATPSFNTDSVLVVRHGRIVSEAHAAPFHAALRHDLRSVTKSVVATLVGAAIHEGKIASADQKVLSFFPGQQPNGAAQDAMTVRHLLDMTSGIQWREWPYNAQSDAIKLWASPDWMKFILERDVAAPGEKFQYIAAAPHLLSAILTRTTGSNAADYGRRGLFKTLGIGDFVWARDPQGNNVGESALRLRPRDMARIGLLHLRQGRWEDRQLLPPQWSEGLFTPGIVHGVKPVATPPTYRTLWWTDASVPYAAANGRHGQHIILLPKQDLMLVVTSKTADASRGSRAPEMVSRYLLPAVKSDGALPEDAASAAKLAEAVERFQRPLGHASQTPSAAAEALSRRKFVLEENPWGYREFTLELSGAPPRYRLLQADKSALFGQSTRGGAIGVDGRYLVSPEAGDRLWARRGRWTDENTFRIETQFMEAAIVQEWTARFDNGALELTYSNGDGDAMKMRGTPRD